MSKGKKIMRRLSWPVYGRMFLRLFVKRTMQFLLWALIVIVALTLSVPSAFSTSLAVEKKVVGSDRADTIRGTAKSEYIKGLKGDDKLYGSRGDDALEGGKGKDRLYGGKGNDAILAKDGHQDRIDCGKGKQDAIWMPYDKGKDRVKDCEKKVNRDGTITDFKDKKKKDKKKPNKKKPKKKKPKKKPKPVDSDRDGLVNSKDKCPQRDGPRSNGGCPVDIPDSDGDGLADDVDSCPGEPGPASNGGCPEPPPPAAQCDDGRDNDGDGRRDFPADPGCDSPTDDTESPDPV